MYVCLCNAYTESDIRAAAAEGARTADEAYCSIGDGPCCGRCIATAQQIIDDVHAESLQGRVTRGPARRASEAGDRLVGTGGTAKAA